MTGTNSRGLVIQERDKHLLRELAVMRVIDRELAKCVAGFGSTTRANTRLLRLVRAGLLRRFFQGTTDGGQRALYSLSDKGAKLAEVPYRGLRRKEEATLIADFFVTHQLAINGLYCMVKFQPIPIENTRFMRWETFFQPVDTDKSLIPDGYVEIRASNKDTAAFLEVDLGHESRTVWRKKVESYLRYGTSGDFPKRFHQHQFRTWVVTDSKRRMNSLREVTAAITQKIFRFTTFESIAREGLWSPIWLRPSGTERFRIL